jgi:hypothetical protein
VAKIGVDMDQLYSIHPKNFKATKLIPMNFPKEYRGNFENPDGS